MLGKKLAELFQQAKIYKDPYTKRTKKALEWLKGEQMRKRHPLRAATVTNYLFSEAMTIIPILSGRIPEVDVTNEYPDMDVEASLLSKLINRAMRINDFPLRQVEINTHSLLAGKGFFKSTWDKDKMGGAGDLGICRSNPVI